MLHTVAVDQISREEADRAADGEAEDDQRVKRREDENIDDGTQEVCAAFHDAHHDILHAGARPADGALCLLVFELALL